MFKVILYHPDEYSIFKDTSYKVCENVEGVFGRLAYREDFPFRDEASVEFLRGRSIRFVSDDDRYAIYRDRLDNIFPITILGKYEQEGLILIYNSQRGVYTHVTHLDDLSIRALKKLDIDILLAVCVDEDDIFDILFTVNDFEAVNFDYGNDLFDFCLKFVYDWRRDLPDIADWIGCKYRGYNLLSGKIDRFKAGVVNDKPIWLDTSYYDREFFSRRLPIMLIEFLKDDSVRLSKINSTKNPTFDEILSDLPALSEDTKMIYFLVLDVDETIRDARVIAENCIFGGWIYYDYIEISSNIQALLDFSCLIPDILRREMILCG